MSTPSLPWFRMYTDFLNDPKMIALAFEDQRHFIGVLALKSDGALEQDCDPDLMDRIVAQRLWIDHAVIREVKKRLIGAGLIDDAWQPLAWDKRQMRSDADATNAERQRRYRQRQKQNQKPGNSPVNEQQPTDSEQNNDDSNGSNALRNAPVTPIDTDIDIDKDNKKQAKKLTGNAQPEKPDEPKAPDQILDGLDVSAWPEVPSPGVWSDYKKLRSQKKAPITQTVINRLTSELRKAAEHRISVDDFLGECIHRGWHGGKAEWMIRDVSGGRANNKHKAGAKHANFADQDYRSGVAADGSF